jgi:hypothetical protein
VTAATWQLTNLLGTRSTLLSHDDFGWSVVLDGEVVAAPSLDEALGRAVRARAGRRRADVASARRRL